MLLIGAPDGEGGEHSTFRPIAPAHMIVDCSILLVPIDTECVGGNDVWEIA